MSVMVIQISGRSNVCSPASLGYFQKKHQSVASRTLCDRDPPVICVFSIERASNTFFTLAPPTSGYSTLSISPVIFSQETHKKHPGMASFGCLFAMPYKHRADSRLAPSQWETVLQCNAVSHWLGANLESACKHRKCCVILDRDISRTCQCSVTAAWHRTGVGYSGVSPGRVCAVSSGPLGCLNDGNVSSRQYLKRKHFLKRHTVEKLTLWNMVPSKTYCSVVIMMAARLMSLLMKKD